MSDYYVTFTGAKVYPGDIYSLDINLIDIAHHLTNIQRYGGALPFNVYYSVAEHSCLMAEYALGDGDSLAKRRLAKACLLHDATEAYLGDVVSPLKGELPEYQALEQRLDRLIHEKYEVDTNLRAEVKSIDKRILLDEVSQLIPARYSAIRESNKGLRKLGLKITGKRSKRSVYNQFLEMCQLLKVED